MKKTFKTLFCIITVVCMVAALFAVNAYADELDRQKGELKAAAYFVVDNYGVQVNGIRRTEEQLGEYGVLYDWKTKTLTVVHDINTENAVGIYNEIEGLTITAYDNFSINVYGAITKEGKSVNYGIYADKSIIFDEKCNLNIHARDIDQSVAKTTVRDDKEVTEFESYGIFANGGVTFKNTNQVDIISGNVGSENAATATSIALAGEGAKNLSGKVNLIAGDVTVKSAANGKSLAVTGEPQKGEEAVLTDGLVRSGDNVYTTGDSVWFIVAIVEFVIILAAAAYIVIPLVKKGKNDNKKAE
ncbi:MAG: hypothetical protein KBS41_06055 [Oscillospiraceae bacterium]|nr:hypothetical protein [Candidatus Equicaccousia limihippi]